MNNYLDKNQAPIDFGKKLITPDGYFAEPSMFGSDKDGRPRILCSIYPAIDTRKFIAANKRAYYPEELEVVDPHEVYEAKCGICNHKWIAVCPQGTETLECPNCGGFTLVKHI